MCNSITRNELVQLATSHGIKKYPSLDDYILENASFNKDQWLYIEVDALINYKDKAIAFFERNKDLIECVTDSAMVCFKQCVVDDPLSHLGVITGYDLGWESLDGEQLFKTYHFEELTPKEAQKMFPDVRLLVQFRENWWNANGDILTKEKFHEVTFNDVVEIYSNGYSQLVVRGYKHSKLGHIIMTDERDPRLKGVENTIRQQS